MRNDTPDDDTAHPAGFVRHARTFASLTLVSRVLGLLRDAVIVRILGVTGLGTAFSIAFQFPNTFRRLFGEGALSAAFIPEYARLLREDTPAAHRFASLIVAVLTAALGAAVLLAEAAILITLAAAPIPDTGRTALVLLALMLPFMPMICVTAALGGMLQTHGRFAAQAGAPIILNLCMIAAAAAAAHAFGAPPLTAALATAAAVSIAGALQILWCLRDLAGIARWTRDFSGVAHHARRMLARMAPVVLGLGAVQLATLIESWVIVAWPLYAGPTILGVPYPLDESAGAALYNAQRLYQFPLGVFGIALATAVFPLLARLAHDNDRFNDTLRRSVRLAFLIGAPATAGLIWVAHDLTAVVYKGGAVTADDTARMARCLIAYGAMVGCYSLTHVLTRAFYARGNTTLPTRISVAAVALALPLAFALMWPLRETGIAVAASIAAAIHLAALAAAAQRSLSPHGTPPFDRPTLLALARIAAATAAMVLALLTLRSFRGTPPAALAWGDHAARLAADILLGGLAYAAAAAALCRDDLRALLDRPYKTAPPPPSPPPPPDQTTRHPG